MMHRQFKIISGIIFLILVACNHQRGHQNLVKRNNGKLIFQIEPDQSIDINAKVQLKNLKLIPLEGTSYSFLGGIAKVELDTTTGQWFILGERRKNSITVFKNNGKFIRRIQHIGRGPGEYQQINDFSLADGRWIEILDGRRQRLIKYNLKNDSLISEKKVPFLAWNYSNLDNGNYVFYVNKQAVNFENKKYFYEILVTDKHFHLQRTRLPFQIKIGHVNYSVMQPKTLTKANHKIYFNNFLADTIYAIAADTIQPDYIINYGRFRFNNPENKTFESGLGKIKYLANHTDEFIMGISYFTNSKKLISFNFIYDDHLYTYLYNKKVNRSRIIKDIKFGRGKISLPKPKLHTGNTYVGFYSWQQISNISSTKLAKDKKLYSPFIQAKKEYQNPVLVLYNFK